MKSQRKTPTKHFGTLYHHSMDAAHGSVVITPRVLKKKERFTQVTGAALASVSMALYLYSFGPLTQASLPKTQVERTPSPVMAAMLPTENILADTIEQSAEQAQASGEVDTSFSLSIPSLQVVAEVFPQIDPYVEAEYDRVLTKGVAHAKGTGLPGEGKRIFLFAHSTNSILNISRYNALFYDIAKLPNGSLIALTYGGKMYRYEVTGQKIVDAGETEWLAPSETNELILQTCWPPGTSWKRLLVIAKSVSE